MARSVRFFSEVIGLVAMLSGDRLTAFDARAGGVLLIFARGTSLADMVDERGTVPGHDGSGPAHMAFSIAEADYEPWRAHLEKAGAGMRGEMRWQSGSRSLYFEDPDGHVLELATPGLWPNGCPTV